MGQIITSRRVLLCFGSLGLLSACSGSTEPKVVPISTITISAPVSTIQATKTIKLTAQAKDASGNILSGRSVVWNSSSNAVATVASDGTLAGIAAGSAVITATSEGVSAALTITVTRAPLAVISVSISPNQLVTGQTVQAVATLTDSTGNLATDATLSWSSTEQTVAKVDANGLVTALGVGTARIDARAEGILGSSTVTVTANPVANCSTSQLLALAVGDIRTLTATQKSLFCIAGDVSASEYVVIPFNNSAVATSTIGLQLNGTNTSMPSAITANIQQGLFPTRLPTASPSLKQSSDWAFRVREYNDLKPAIAALRGLALRFSRELSPSHITGIPATPAVGDVFPVNANLVGNTCTGAKQLHGARVIAVMPHVIVLADTLAPAGGYTSDELIAFGQGFESSGYGLDTLNFGAPTDIDANGRVAVFFTPGVNLIPGPTGSFIGGLQAGRDLFPVTSCPGSNEGEIFYMPVPDPNKTLNANYATKSALSNIVLATLVHEFQHLINLGRRVYVNGASGAEEIWLNEGLSHIAEELLYYEASGNSPRSNIDLSTVTSSQAQLNAINTYQLQNLERLGSYMLAPEGNSPYAQNDNLETRGAIWQLLRYAADRKGGIESSTWFSLVNSTTAGQANFNDVFGDIVSMSRDWAVAQFADDLGFAIDASYANPSWNFRSLMPPISGGTFPLLTRALVTSPVDISLVGGAAAYIRFQVGGATTATLTVTSSGQPVPSGVDVIVMRTR